VDQATPSRSSPKDHPQQKNDDLLNQDRIHAGEGDLTRQDCAGLFLMATASDPCV